VELGVALRAGQVLLDLAHLAASEPRRDADVASVRGARERAGLRREDRREAEAEDSHGHHHLEQREPPSAPLWVSHHHNPVSTRSDSSPSLRGLGMANFPFLRVAFPVSGETKMVIASCSASEPAILSWIAARSVWPPGQK